MKNFITAVLFLITSTTYATNYYISLGGSDTNDGKSPSTAWKTINKVNTMMAVFKSGDSILFKCNEIFYGLLKISNSGTPAATLNFNAYSTGAKPVISAMRLVTNWNIHSANIWKATIAYSSAKITNVTINDKPQQLGRYPNADAPSKGYLYMESTVGNMQFTDNQSGATPNWTNAEAVMRTQHWILDKAIVKKHAGNTITLIPNNNYDLKVGYGYFFQNSLQTLDKSGEWYYDAAAKTLYMYSTAKPLNVKVTVDENAVSILNQRFISVKNLQFQGGSTLTATAENCSFINFVNNDVVASGENAVTFNNCKRCNVRNNNIDQTNNNALGFFNCFNIELTGNKIKNTAIRAGMGKGGDGQYDALLIDKGKNHLIKNNMIDSTGYVGIDFRADSVVIKNNVVSNFCLTKDDGSGIYTWNDQGTKAFYGQVIDGNIVYNGIGVAEGTDDLFTTQANGIYMDDSTQNVTIKNNTVFNCTNIGLYLHNTRNIKADSNTIFNNQIQFTISHDLLTPNISTTGCTITNNIFAAKARDQKVAVIETIDNSLDNFGTINNNYYCHPYKENSFFFVRYYPNRVFEESLYNLDGWKKTRPYDANSKGSPYTYNGYTLNGQVGNNKITNGKFGTDINNWYCYAPKDNCNASWKSNSLLDGGALKLNLVSPFSVNDEMLAYTNIGTVVKDKTYLLNFSAVAAKSFAAVPIMIRQDADPYTEILSNRDYFYATSTRKEYSVLLTANNAAPSARIEYELNKPDSIVYVDNVSVQQVNITYANTSDSLRFDYNTTQLSKNILLNEWYTDAAGKRYSGTVLLPPFSCLVLFKIPAVKAFNTTDKAAGINMLLYPNPVKDYFSLQLPGAFNYADTELKIFDTEGKSIKQILLQGINQKVSVADLAPGYYTIQIISVEKIYSTKFIKQ